MYAAVMSRASSALPTPAGPGRGVDLVVHVGDVRDERHLESLVDEKPFEQREDHERARVADVDWPVDGRPAGIDPYLAGLSRPKLLHGAGPRVMKQNLAQGPATLAPAGAGLGAVGGRYAANVIGSFADCQAARPPTKSLTSPNPSRCIRLAAIAER